jgi:hypothetical protein
LTFSLEAPERVRYGATMRSLPLASFSVLLALACAPTGSATSAGDSETDTDTSGTGTEANPTTSGDDDGNACTPGKVEVCPCLGGEQGTQTCNPNGQGYGPCICPDPTTGNSASADDSTTVDPSDGTTTNITGETTTTTTGESTTELTATSGTSDATMSTTDAESTSTTGDPDCPDPGDAPDVEADADNLGGINCNDASQEYSGVLAGDGDVDWFQWHGEDFGCGMLSDPDVVHNLTANDNLRLCVFVECDMGNPAFQCQNGAQMNMSPDGRPGCCDNNSITYTLNCMGAPETAQVYVRLDMADADTCVDYTVEYSYEGGF